MTGLKVTAEERLAMNVAVDFVEVECAAHGFTYHPPHAVARCPSCETTRNGPSGTEESKMSSIRKLEREEKRDLPCKLTENELKLKGKRIGEVVKEAGVTEAKRKSSAEKFKGQLATLDHELHKIAAELETGEEQRLVECEWDFDPDHGKKTLFRTDTKAKVQSSNMESWEIDAARQQGLDFKTDLK